MPLPCHSRRAALMLAIALLAGSVATAQRYSFRTYGSAEGLSDLNPNHILQDRDGFLWIATTSGVYRFDGHRFRRYSVDEGLQSSHTLSLAEAENGDVLVSNTAGVARLRNDRFVAVDTRGHVPAFGTQVLAQAGETTYVASTTGLFWRDAHNRSGIVPSTEGKLVSSVLPVTAGPDMAIAGPGELVAHDVVWFGMNDSVCLWRTKAETIRCFSGEAGLPADKFGALAIDGEGTLWARSSSRLLALPRGASKFEPRDSGLAVSTRRGALSLDSSGRIMVPTQEGLSRWVGGNSSAVKSGSEKWSTIGASRGLELSSVTYAIEDREGSIWIAMLGAGLTRWLGSGEWESWTTQQGLSGDLVSTITRNKDGRLLIGTSAGVDILDGHGPRLLAGARAAASTSRIRALATDGAHSLWMLMATGSLGELDTLTGKERQFGASVGLPASGLFSVLVDHAGGVWAVGPGVFRGVREVRAGRAESWRWQKMAIGETGKAADSSPGALNPAASEETSTIIEDHENRVWLGGTKGLSYWNGQRIQRLGADAGMPDGAVGSMAVAPNGDIVVALNEVADLFRISSSSDSHGSVHFGVRRFPGPRIAGIGGSVFIVAFDHAGNLWRAGSMGIDEYIQNRWIHYTRADGLVWDSVSRNAFVADDDGSVWIGTAKGLSHHYPVAKQSGGRETAGRALIVGVTAGGRELATAATSKIDYHSGNIVISFASPVFVHEKDIRFRYSLSGLDTGWTQTDDWEARYSGVKPGHYVFEVESGVWGGRWDGEPARLPFDVTGPFWTSAWFIPACIGVLTILAFSGWRIRDAAHLRNESQLRAAVALRTGEVEAARQQEKSRSLILENLVSNQPLRRVLEGIASLVTEDIARGAAVILIRDSEGWRAAAVSGCPAEWSAALEAPDAIPAEACAGAFFCGAPYDEPSWKIFLSLCGATPPVAIGSMPIGGAERAAGIFLFLYSTQPERRTCTDVLEYGARMAQVAIEHHRFYDDLQFQARHDSLTGLPNRSAFSERLKQALGIAEARGERMAVLFIDIDRFMEINDRFSHRAGDIVLSTLAKRMISVVRSSDTVARIGGDEFNILLENIAGPDAVHDISGAVLSAIREPLFIDGVRLDVSASIGIAVFPDDAAEPETLQREADAAMYCAKSLGKNRVQAFGNRDGALDNEHVDEALREALQESLFTVHYQPKVTTLGGFAGFEALLRLNHPKLGNVPPDVFIPVAEAKGLIVPIGTWVLGEVCRQIAEWRDRGFGDIQVAINVSPVQIARADFADIVRECLIRRNVPPQCIELELTESRTLNGADEAREQMKVLRGIGVRISIDDFGAGYSSLSYLYRLNVDAIKLDRSFVQSIDTDEGARRVVQAMIGVAGALGLTVIAEGVETDEQRAALVAEGCPFMQGYFFSRPQPASSFEELLAGRLQPGADLRRLYAAVEAQPELASV